LCKFPRQHGFQNVENALLPVPWQGVYLVEDTFCPACRAAPLCGLGRTAEQSVNRNPQGICQGVELFGFQADAFALPVCHDALGCSHALRKFQLGEARLLACGRKQSPEFGRHFDGRSARWHVRIIAPVCGNIRNCLHEYTQNR